MAYDSGVECDRRDFLKPVEEHAKEFFSQDNRVSFLDRDKVITDSYIELCKQEIELHKAKGLEYQGAEYSDDYSALQRVAKIKQMYPKFDWTTASGTAWSNLLKQFDAAFDMMAQHRTGKLEGVASRLLDVSAYCKITGILWNKESRDVVGTVPSKEQR